MLIYDTPVKGLLNLLRNDAICTFFPREWFFFLLSLFCLLITFATKNNLIISMSNSWPQGLPLAGCGISYINSNT